LGELIGSSHALGDFEYEPAESGETDSPKKHYRDHRLPLLFTGWLRLYRAIASNKLLKANRRLKFIVLLR
jgi:hypothetical protein